MLIDAHTHILSLAEDAEFTTEYGREGSLCIYRSLGRLPAHRTPTEAEWEASGYSRKGFPVIGPAESIRDHPGFDKTVILAVSPQFLEGELIGTVDSYGITGVPGPSTPEKCNDYIAAIVASMMISPDENQSSCSPLSRNNCRKAIVTLSAPNPSQSSRPVRSRTLSLT